MRYTLNNFVVPFVKIIEGDNNGEARFNLVGQYFTIIQDAKYNMETTDIFGIYTAILKKHNNLVSLKTDHEKAAYTDLMIFFNTRTVAQDYLARM